MASPLDTWNGGASNFAFAGLGQTASLKSFSPAQTDLLQAMLKQALEFFAKEIGSQIGGRLAVIHAELSEVRANVDQRVVLDQSEAANARHEAVSPRPNTNSRNIARKMRRKRCKDRATFCRTTLLQMRPTCQLADYCGFNAKQSPGAQVVETPQVPAPGISETIAPAPAKSIEKMVESPPDAGEPNAAEQANPEQTVGVGENCNQKEAPAPVSKKFTVEDLEDQAKKDKPNVGEMVWTKPSTGVPVHARIPNRCSYCHSCTRWLPLDDLEDVGVNVISMRCRQCKAAWEKIVNG